MSRFGYRSMVHAVAVTVTFSPKTTAIYVITGSRRWLCHLVSGAWRPSRDQERQDDTDYWLLPSRHHHASSGHARPCNTITIDAGTARRKRAPSGNRPWREASTTSTRRSARPDRALDCIADRWTALNVGSLAERTHRLASRIEGISPNVLVQTLRSLERDGLVLRQPLATTPPTVEYSLPPDGRTGKTVGVDP